jgi:polyphosphate glucokinase
MPVARRTATRRRRVLAVDVGGSHVKVLVQGAAAPRRFDSGPALTAAQMARGVVDGTKDWRFDVVSIGFPGPVLNGRPVAEPVNLGRGWVAFDYGGAFGRPVKIVNDAAMQALGSYEGGRMLFLGLGTGLGSAMVIDGSVEPMELAHLPYKKGGTYEDYVGRRGLERLGKKKWRREVASVVEALESALQADYVVLGGGNASKLKELPPGARLGANANAFVGGFRLWDAARTPQRPSAVQVPRRAKSVRQRSK